MANVYRKGHKDVHRAIRENGEDYDLNACNLDGGGEYGPDIPPGPQCPRCFAGLGDEHGAAPVVPRRRWKRRHAVAAGSGASILAVLAGLASQGGPVPVATIAPLVSASASGDALTSFSIETGTPTALPHSPEPSPRARTVPTVGPAATGIPAGPTPIPKPEPTCLHPGKHKGVKDPCQWPGNR